MLTPPPALQQPIRHLSKPKFSQKSKPTFNLKFLKNETLNAHPLPALQQPTRHLSKPKLNQKSKSTLDLKFLKNETLNANPPSCATAALPALDQAETQPKIKTHIKPEIFQKLNLEC